MKIHLRHMRDILFSRWISTKIATKIMMETIIITIIPARKRIITVV